MNKYPVIIVLISVVFYANYIKIDTEVTAGKETIGIKKLSEIKNLPALNPVIRDTFYTLKSSFIEVNLKTQTGYLHIKGDTVFEFGVSTGNKKLSEAVETNEGLFVIQSKMPKWYSQQFDSTLMINWMGFNYGIGFHALAGNSYYKYLGKKKSSHGCVRISREDSRYIYSKVETGTPVLVHSGNNAVYVGFADSVDINNFSEYSFRELNKILSERLNNLYGGRYFINPVEKILISRSNIGHNGLQIGESYKIPEKQAVPPGSIDNFHAVSDGVIVKFNRQI